MKKAIINGITGQDGIYMAKLLLNKGYEVTGIVRNIEKTKELSGKHPGIVFKVWDMRSEECIRDILTDHKPNEFYNFAAYSSGEGMFNNPIGIGEINGLAVTRILEAIKTVDPSIRLCQASSREIFGLATESPQTENTFPNPRSPYGAAKLYADSMVRIYREHYNIFGCSAILFNHESPLRGLHFVTRKITHTAAKIKMGLEKKLYLGNLDTHRDWGFAGDYVRAMWLMLQNSLPGDYIIGSGQIHTVRDFCRITFEYLEMDYNDFVVGDEVSFRPSEPLHLVGNIGKAKTVLNWEPNTNLHQLIKMMVDADLEQLHHKLNQL